MASSSAMQTRRESDEQPVACCTSPGLIRDLSLSSSQEDVLRKEIQRLQRRSVILRVVGLRPNRSEIRHMLQILFKEDLPDVVDIQFLGYGCFHIEFIGDSAAEIVLRKISASIKGCYLQFIPWTHGFSAKSYVQQRGRLFSFTAFFPGLAKDWRIMLRSIGELIAPVLEEDGSWSQKSGELFRSPSVKLLGSPGLVLPEYIRLPSVIEGSEPVIQKVIYRGLPNQCFGCKEEGHLQSNCPYETVQKSDHIPVEKDVHNGWTVVKNKSKKAGKILMDKNLGNLNRFSPLQNISCMEDYVVDTEIYNSKEIVNNDSIVDEDNLDVENNMREVEGKQVSALERVQSDILIKDKDVLLSSNNDLALIPFSEQQYVSVEERSLVPINKEDFAGRWTRSRGKLIINPTYEEGKGNVEAFSSRSKMYKNSTFSDKDVVVSSNRQSARLLADEDRRKLMNSRRTDSMQE